ncbi:hypothetical protein BJ973_004042 [Actinoplanes tereljensis]|uniref:SH3 domain-containing protein n=1 Tax=Paractinoplanes tereljensis TaxID=571912 RepID=A0A919NSG1_9ACTN|nr:hypothetical protein [Actinoplanes tereljensis]GIF23430.1 hypothetical protein Ate02nite_61600 [Actinoplanes tereljensis]
MNSRTKRMVKRIAGGAAAVVLSVTSGLVATTSPAQAAADCDESIYIRNGDGSGKFTRTGTLEAGPYGACDDRKTLAKGAKFWIHCSWPNDYGNLWYYVRLEGTSTYGWVWEGDVSVSYTDDNNDGILTIYSCG